MSTRRDQHVVNQRRCLFDNPARHARRNATSAAHGRTECAAAGTRNRREEKPAAAPADEGSNAQVRTSNGNEPCSATRYGPQRRQRDRRAGWGIAAAMAGAAKPAAYKPVAVLQKLANVGALRGSDNAAPREAYGATVVVYRRHSRRCCRAVSSSMKEMSLLVMLYNSRQIR